MMGNSKWTVTASGPRHGIGRRRAIFLSGMLSLLAVLVGLQACSSTFPVRTRPSTVAVPAPKPAEDPEYYIGPEDVLQISVWKEDELNREVLVRPDGGISFPLAGDLQAAGKTPAELQSELTHRIRRYVPAAVVTVSVSKISGYRVYIIGKVNNPGQFVVGRYVDVMQALTLAGGLTPYASENKIRIIRRSDKGEQVFPFEYSRVKSGYALEQNILLKSGDVVVVP